MKKVSQNATDSSINIVEGDSENQNEITALPRYQSQSRKRKADEKDDFEENLLKILKTPENRHLHFFKGILPSLQSLNDHQTLIFQSRVLQVLTDILRPSIQQYTPHDYTLNYQQQSYNQGYSTQRHDNTFHSGSSSQIHSEPSNQHPINSPFTLDETTSTSYGTQDEEFDFS